MEINLKRKIILSYFGIAKQILKNGKRINFSKRRFNSSSQELGVRKV